VALSKLGHKVTLSDISSSELELATEYAMKENVSLDKILQADARQLSSVFFMKGEYDIVLLLGPLYHLLQETERLDVIDSCIAITKPKGYIICSFVTKFAHLRDLVQKDPGRLLREKQFYDEYSLTGSYIRNGGIRSHHTHLAEIQQLFNKIGNSSLAVRKLVACEGFLGGGLTKHLVGLGEDEYRAWVDITLATAEDPHVLSASDHIAVVAERC
jgi:S-adenosylmethionine-dependent methyltransferase